MSCASFKSFSFCLISFIFISSSFPFVKVQADSVLCRYQLKVKTLDGGGTTSSVALIAADKEETIFVVPDLASWNIIKPPPPGGYFQDGAEDTFDVTALGCLRSAPCMLSVVISGSGDRPSWGCDTIEITTPQSTTHIFKIGENINNTNFINSCNRDVQGSRRLGGDMGSSILTEFGAMSPRKLANTAASFRGLFERMMTRS